MRHYAPHNTNFQTWTSSGLQSRPHQPPATLRNRFFSIFARLRLPITRHPSPLSATVPSPEAHDDLHVQPRLSALHRWLDISAPLTSSACCALRALMRQDAVIVRTHRTTKCVVCGQPLQNHPSLQTQTPWIGADYGILYVLSFVFFGVFLIFSALRARISQYRTILERRRIIRARREELHAAMHSARYYSIWYTAAAELDHLDANHAWMTEGTSAVIDNLCSDCSSYLNSASLLKCRTAELIRTKEDVGAEFDIDMLTAKLRELSVLYNRQDIRGLAFALRASLIRNFGGMCHPKLHSHSLVGTNRIVEDYVHVVSYLLAYVAQANIESPQQQPADSSSRNMFNESKDISTSQRSTWSSSQNVPSASDSMFSVDDPSKLSLDDKVTFLNEARHAYGRTALMLSGGAAMGLHHFGVVKCLLDADLLPRVVCGTSAGALIASAVGIFDDEELGRCLSADELINPLTNHPFSFRFFGDDTSFQTRFKNLIRNGHLEDVSVLQDTLRYNFGDLTFEEAYKRTGRILNITVCPIRSSSGPPLLLNYLTAPHVLIWSAASASCAIPMMWAAVELVAKSANGRLVPYHPEGVRWIDGSITSDVPLARIGELFNVNHFIVSQTNPHVIPRSSSILHTKIAMLIKSELQFRYWQALQMGLVPRMLSAIFPHFMQPYAGDVTIMPDVRLSDLRKLMQNPTPELVKQLMRRGEMQTYPYVDSVRLNCSIERALDKCVEYIAAIPKHEEGLRSTESDAPRRGIFPRVPSWLWLDTRSLLSGGGVGAVTSRLTRRYGDRRTPATASGNKGGDSDKADERADSPSSHSSATRTALRAQFDAVEELLDDDVGGDFDLTTDNDVDALVDSLVQDVNSRQIKAFGMEGDNKQASRNRSSESEDNEEDRVFC